jgi:uncharacterized membrane protein YqaE (UPF0057 family)
MSAADPMPGVLTILLAVLLPPLGVWMARGLGPAFWISLLLTLFGWLPGMLFALVAVLRPDFLPNRA